MKEINPIARERRTSPDFPSQIDVAQGCGWSQGLQAQIESGYILPRPEQVEKIATFLKVNATALNLEIVKWFNKKQRSK